jgi:hypothetical protein
MKYPYKIILVFLFAFGCVKVYAQGIRGIIAKIDTFHNRLPGEKVYMQFDKPYYSVGDTIWFKGYLVNPTFSYSSLSARLYVELVNDSNRVIKTMAVPVDLGVTWGNMALLPGDIKEGSYTLRAYTTWMRNFGQDAFFYQSFYIANPQTQAWLVNASSALTTAGLNSTVKMDVKFHNLANAPVVLNDLQLKVLDGKRVIFKGVGQTTTDGTLNVSFPLLEKNGVKNLKLVAQDKANARQTVTIPVSADRAKDVDVQFMPEGGAMIAGIPSHIGFKVIGEDGKGIDVSGEVINTASGQSVLTFNSLHAGMGFFDLLPKTGETYTAKIKLPDGQTKDIALPAIKSSGAALRIHNAANRDTIDVSINLSDDMVKQNVPLYLVGQSREVVCFAATIPAGTPSLSVHVSKGLFPSGVAHFSLLTADDMPVNERLTFISHNDNLKIAINPEQSTYSTRDSIPVKITVKDDMGKPVLGSFSVAVTDDGQVKWDNSDAGTILTHLLLTSDLKGFVENPAWYFTNDKNAWASLDALLLTQGWVGYDWKSINTPPKPAFEPEFTHTVKGSVTSPFNKPITNATVALISTGKFRFVRDTLTNTLGKFTFDKIPPVDSSTFVLEARNTKTRKVLHAGIGVDQVTTPETKGLNLSSVSPWYVNSNGAILNFVKSNTDYHKELDIARYSETGITLRQVDIHGQAIIKGSDNLNGAGNADQVVDEEAVNNAGKATLFDLIEKQVKGYRVGFLPKSQKQDFFLRDKKLHFVFDGIDITRFYVPNSDQPDDYYFYVKQYLDYFSAEDIKGIEVLYSAKYIHAYAIQNVDDNDEYVGLDAAGPRGSDYAFLEITTRSGAGPYMKKANGVYVYRPTPTTRARSFYRPRYLVKNTAKNLTDLRSTIHWAPNVITNKNGEAFVSFYAADKPTTYTIIMEGSDLNGKIGYQTQKLTIEAGAK